MPTDPPIPSPTPRPTTTDRATELHTASAAASPDRHQPPDRFWFGERLNARGIVDELRSRTLYLEAAINRFSDAFRVQGLPGFWDHPSIFREVLLKRVIDRLHDEKRIRGFVEHIVDLVLHLSLPCSIDSMLHLTVFAIMMEEYVWLALHPLDRDFGAPRFPITTDVSIRLALGPASKDLQELPLQ